MKKIVSLLFVISSICFSSCQKVKSDTAIFSMSTHRGELQVLTAQQAGYMIKNEFNFNLLLYTEGCSYCEKALESAYEVQIRYDYAIYKLEMNAAAYSYFLTTFPSLFKQDDIYPALYLFSEGKISYKIDYETLQNYKSLARVMVPQLYSSRILCFQDCDAFEYYFNEATNALVYAYDSSRDDNNGQLTQKIINYGGKPSDYFTIFFDKNTANSTLISKFYQYTGLSNESTFDYLLLLENGQIKTTVRYLSADGNQIDNLLDSIS